MFLSLNLLWSEYLHVFQHCNYKMGLHLKYSAVYKDAVASEHPGNFVCSTGERASLLSKASLSPPVIHGIHELPSQRRILRNCTDQGMSELKSL